MSGGLSSVWSGEILLHYRLQRWPPSSAIFFRKRHRPSHSTKRYTRLESIQPGCHFHWGQVRSSNVSKRHYVKYCTEVIMWQSVFASSSVRQQPCIVVQRKEPIRESWWFDPRPSLTNSRRNSLYGIAATLQHRYILFSNILNDYDGCETNFTELRWPSLTFHSWDRVLNKVETERYKHVMLSWFIAGS